MNVDRSRRFPILVDTGTGRETLICTATAYIENERVHFSDDGRAFMRGSRGPALVHTPEHDLAQSSSDEPSPQKPTRPKLSSDMEHREGREAALGKP